MHVFYILMRTDLRSMAASKGGKAMAHSAHAANAAESFMETAPTSLLRAWKAWKKEAKGFGTTLTLAIDEESMKGAVAYATAAGFAAGVVHDPTYPMPFKGQFYQVPMDTCAWIFGDKDALSPILSDFPLHP